LDVTYFKPFKIAFRKEQNVAMAKKQLFGTRQIHLGRMVKQIFATIFEKIKLQI